MIAFLLRLLLAFVLISLVMSVTRAVLTWARDRGVRSGARRRPLREDPPTQRTPGAPVPPEDVIDVSYKDVP